MQEDRRRLIASLEIVTGAGIILVWLAFFFFEMTPANPPACYFAYIHALPVAEGLLAILLLVTGILSMKGKPMGTMLSLIAAGALIFLGVVDISFNIQNGIYVASNSDLVINGLINLWCLGFGAAIIILNSITA